MARNSGLIIFALFVATPAQAADEAKQLAKECERIYQVYPTLMLAAMMEGDVNCGDPDSGESVSCYENETAEQKAARQRRLAVRQHQEAAYKAANEACRAWEADRGSAEGQATLVAAIGNARATDSGKLENRN